jgi:hypothetical protein
MEKAMQYRYTDTDQANTVFDLSIGDLADLRSILTKALNANVEGISGWKARDMIRKLAEAQAKAADAMAYEAKMLAEKAKLPDDL